MFSYFIFSNIRRYNPTNIQNFNEFFAGIRKVSSHLKGAESGKLFAFIRCPHCQKHLKVTKQHGGCWLIGNFVKHCETKHFSMPREIRGRKKGVNKENWPTIEEEDGEPNTTELENSVLGTKILESSLVTVGDGNLHVFFVCYI